MKDDLYQNGFKDGSLSFGGIGILAYIFSAEDTDNISPKTILRVSKEGQIKIQNYFNELINLGYAVRLEVRLRNNGQYAQQACGYAFFDVRATQEDVEQAKRAFVEFHSCAGLNYEISVTQFKVQAPKSSPTKNTVYSFGKPLALDAEKSSGGDL